MDVIKNGEADRKHIACAWRKIYWFALWLVVRSVGTNCEYFAGHVSVIARVYMHGLCLHLWCLALS